METLMNSPAFKSQVQADISTMTDTLPKDTSGKRRGRPPKSGGKKKMVGQVACKNPNCVKTTHRGRCKVINKSVPNQNETGSSSQTPVELESFSEGSSEDGGDNSDDPDYRN